MEGFGDARAGSAAGGQDAIENSLRQQVNRRQARHAMLFDCFRHVITDSSLLYLGAGDGQWCTELAMAGALQVVAVEQQREQIDKFNSMPAIGARERVKMHHALPLVYLEEAAEAGERFDLVVMVDVLREASDLYGIFSDLAALRPRMVLGDGVFASTDEPILRLEPRRSFTKKPRPPYVIPSRGAVTQAAEAMGFEVDWTDWTQLPSELRDGLADYYRDGPLCRASFTLIDSQI